MGLTAKQEKFCQGVAKGLSYSEAYREAYNANKMSEKTIWENASRLAKNSRVTARLEELRSKIEEELIYSAKESFNKLKELQDKAELNGNINAAIKAEELKGKLVNLYKEKEQNVSVSVNVMPAVKVDGNEFELDIGADGDDRATEDS